MVVFLLAHDDFDLIGEVLLAGGAFPNELRLDLVHLALVFVFLDDEEREGCTEKVENALVADLGAEIEDGLLLVHQDVLLVTYLPESTSLFLETS